MKRRRVSCYLSDYNGNRLCPFEPGGIQYREIDSCVIQRVGMETRRMVLVSIQGFIKCETSSGNSSLPIPFEIRRRFIIDCHWGARLEFRVKFFECIASFTGKNLTNASILVTINMDSEVVDSSNGEIGEVGFLLGCKQQFHYHIQQIPGEVYCYHAIGDGGRIYTNKQQEETADRRGLLSPEEVSFYQVFVNGILMGKEHYRLEKGRIEFNKEHKPGPNELLVILYISLYDRWNHVMAAKVEQFVTKSDGRNKYYRWEEGMGSDISNRIRNPSAISKYNLYINGILQPSINYKVGMESLELLTEDVPVRDALVILEGICLFDETGKLLHMDERSYSTNFEGSKVMRSDREILCEKEVSYQILYVNGAIQSKCNYLVEPECLKILTKDDPVEGAVITLQSVRVASIK